MKRSPMTLLMLAALVMGACAKERVVVTEGAGASAPQVAVPVAQEINPPRNVPPPEVSPAVQSEPSAVRGPRRADLASTIMNPGSFENTEVRATYAKARQIPERLDAMYCYCHCKENQQLRHKSLLTCFQDDHAAQCGICLREAQQAFLDFEDGLPVEVTKKTVDVMYNQGNPPGAAGHVH